MRYRWFAALFAALGFVAQANAQPKPNEPSLEVRLRSANDLIAKAEYVAGLAGQDEFVKQFRQIVKALSADGKGIEGIDPTKPFGLTATVTPGVVDSEFMLMAPIADKARFLKMLEERAQITAEKVEGDADLYKIPVPAITEAYLRFASGYVFAGRTKVAVEAKALPDLKAFFGKDDGSVASVVLHLDRIPDFLKALVVSQFEAGIAEQVQKGGAPDAIAKPVGDNLTSALKSFIEDTKTITARVFVDEKADDLSAEVTLTAKPNSTLAKNLAGLGGRTSLPAGIVGTAKGAVRLTAKIGVPDGVKQDLNTVVDAAFAEILKSAPDDEGKEVLEKILKAIAPTIKGGELDLAVAFTEADAKDAYSFLAAAGVKNGKDIEKLVKELEKKYGQRIAEAATFEFDVEKFGAFTLHKVTVKALPEEAEKVFGGNKIWIATSEDCLAVSIEPEGTAIKAGLKAKAASVPVLSVDVAFAKLVPLIARSGNLKPDEVKAILKDAFKGADWAGKDTLTLTVTGGDQLTVKGKLKGPAVRLIAGFALMGRKVD